ncbi:hypothetical protein OESDEN_09401 [Oesophagostomum dentatum]|uniref:PIN domain-containing protein n=1 Tax=Oesophagostomum dentatum TaxID=61180 RepID=A0A0B1T3M8_OESDE|nr:hypothetical protein OESDEN_09401 [Oesophagostomum dentatum]
MREVFDAVDKIIAKRDSSFFTDMVAPLTESERSSGDGVLQLLTRLIKSIESEKCRGTLTSLVDFYLTAATHAAAYGTCVARQAEKITKDACADEFSKLLECVKKQCCITMKVKRIKRANRILTFFKYNYKIAPPFRVLVDGTFCNAALANKINLREQLPKYLGGDVEIVTTKCVLAELEQVMSSFSEGLGPAVYGALVICRQFTVDMCPHMPHRSPTECLAHLARRATKGHTKYIVATNVRVFLASIVG